MQTFFGKRKSKQSELCKVKNRAPEKSKTFWEKGEAREQAQTFFGKRKSKQSELCKIKIGLPKSRRLFGKKEKQGSRRRLSLEKESRSKANFASTPWRRRRDLNPRAAFATYTLSRGASSADLSTSPNILRSFRFSNIEFDFENISVSKNDTESKSCATRLS